LDTNESIKKLRTELKELLNISGTVRDFDDRIKVTRRNLNHRPFEDFLKDDVLWSTRKKVDTYFFLKSCRAEETRKPRKRTTISYGTETTLNWLVFGSDERENIIRESNTASEETVSAPLDKNTAHLLFNDGIKAPIKPLNMEGLPEIIEDEIHRVFNSLTDKEQEAVAYISVLKKSYQETGDILKVNKKSIYERLYGKNGHGGAVAKIHNNARLVTILKKLGFYPPQKGGLVV